MAEQPNTEVIGRNGDSVPQEMAAGGTHTHYIINFVFLQIIILILHIYLFLPTSQLFKLVASHTVSSPFFFLLCTLNNEKQLVFHFNYNSFFILRKQNAC